jgi:CRP-like cAMP-binding protein
MERTQKNEKNMGKYCPELFCSAVLIQNWSNLHTLHLYAPVRNLKTENIFILERNFKRSIGIVLSGGLKAVKKRENGKEILLNTFENGGIFGVAGLFNSSCRYVSDIIAMRRSRVLFLPQALIKDLIYKDPHIAGKLYRISFQQGAVSEYLH